MDNFVHLHLHSEYSLLDGACRIKELVSRVKEMGQTAVAVTDHGCMYAAVDFYNAAKEQGIKAIIGCEVYVAPRTRFDKVHGIDNKPYHLVLLCKNNVGYNNLIKLVSLASVEGFYNKPRVDLEILEQYNEGLIALSGCLAGEIPRLLMNGDYIGAKDVALKYKNIFGDDNYYIEVQNHNIRDEISILPMLYKLSAETGIKLAATNDAHYIYKTDAKIQKVLVAIQTNSLITDDNSMFFPIDEFYMKSYDEMMELFHNVPDAVHNTTEIAERCNVEFEFGKIKLPRFDIKGYEHKDNPVYFKNLCYKGMHKRYGENPPANIVARMDYELEIITKMGYVDYYLIVWDFVRYAKENNIPVSPGRGSGVGSIAAYCIGITGIDPIKYNLLFERFLNPERVSMPDFDIDFCYEKRQRVIDYVVKKYGSDRVAQIITFGTMAAKAAVRDVARVMNISYQIGDKVAKMIPWGTDLSSALEKNEELMSFYRLNANVRELIDTAKRIEGMPRHCSTHAAGVVISDAPVSEYVPVQKNDESVITQYPMNILESLGLLKMDFLGLRYLTVIHNCADNVRKRNPQFNVNNIPIDDTEVYDMISKGETLGVFQFESAGMRQVLTRMKPEAMEDLIAVVSLYRPGPMDSIPKYIENRHNPEKVVYKHPILKNILDVTYGCIVYQEQVMEICRAMAGYSYGQADLVRRAMAKKKAHIMEQERAGFVSGALKNGVSENIANEIFDEMAGFAAYAFNKSHAAAYAYTSYQTAYLKCHYYSEYMSALMTSVLENSNKLMEYISDCKKHGISILPPDINESNSGFTAYSDKIRFALLAIKNLGKNVIDDIINERVKSGGFTSFQNFCERMNGYGLNKRGVESLIKAGAFDRFEYNRRQLLENYEMIFDSSHNSIRSNVEGQINFFDTGDKSIEKLDIIIPKQPEYDFYNLLEMEKEIMGMYISGHPLDEYEVYSRARKVTRIIDIISDETVFNDNDEISLLCIVQAVKLHTTKSNTKMLFVQLGDMTGEIEGIVFPNIYMLCGKMFQKGDILYINGKISYKDDDPKILIESVLSANQFVSVNKNMNIYVKCKSDDMNNIQNILNIVNKSEYSGTKTIMLYFYDINKKVMSKNAQKVDISSKLIKELSELVGIDNVALAK